MWFAVVFGVLIYKFMKGIITSKEFGPDWDSGIKIMVAKRLEKIYGGKAFQALRIPDIASGARQSIDIVLLTKRELSIIAVRNFSGILDVGADGGWTQKNSRGQSVKIPNPVEETRGQAAILESYLERRGVAIPAGFMSCKVILTNLDCRPLLSVALQPEVLCYDKWMQLNEETHGGFRSWAKRIFSGMELDTPDKIDKKIRFILDTSPTWDRLELKGTHPIFGEFLGFKGKKEDMDALQVIKRSKVAKIVNYKPIMFDFLGGGSTVQLFCSSRDYRQEGPSQINQIEVNVRRDTEVVFQPIDAKKAQQFKIKKLVSMSLSP